MSRIGRPPLQSSSAPSSRIQIPFPHALPLPSSRGHAYSRLPHVRPLSPPHSATPHAPLLMAKSRSNPHSVTHPDPPASSPPLSSRPAAPPLLTPDHAATLLNARPPSPPQHPPVAYSAFTTLGLLLPNHHSLLNAQSPQTLVVACPAFSRPWSVLLSHILLLLLICILLSYFHFSLYFHFIC